MHYPDILLSEYGSSSSIPSPVNRMMASFAADFRTEVDINLGVGYVNERTIPRERILDAMREVLAHPDRYRASLNYGGAKGSANLIESIRLFYERNAIGGLTRDILDRKEIIIGPNGATSLLEGIASVIEPGIVITSDPMYYIYCNFLERRGFEVVTVPEDSEGMPGIPGKLTRIYFSRIRVLLQYLNWYNRTAHRSNDTPVPPDHCSYGGDSRSGAASV